jgi:hypothetical protein
VILSIKLITAFYSSTEAERKSRWPHTSVSTAEIAALCRASERVTRTCSGRWCACGHRRSLVVSFTYREHRLGGESPGRCSTHRPGRTAGRVGRCSGGRPPGGSRDRKGRRSGSGSGSGHATRETECTLQVSGRVKVYRTAPHGAGAVRPSPTAVAAAATTSLGSARRTSPTLRTVARSSSGPGVTAFCEIIQAPCPSHGAIADDAKGHAQFVWERSSRCDARPSASRQRANSMAGPSERDARK